MTSSELKAFIDHNEIKTEDNSTNQATENTGLIARSITGTGSPEKASVTKLDKAVLIFDFDSNEALINFKDELKLYLSKCGISFPISSHRHETWPKAELLKVMFAGSKLFCGAIKSNAQTKRLKLELSGQGLEWLRTKLSCLSELFSWFYSLKPKLQEVHIAFDDFSGKYCIRNMLKSYSAGRYKPKRGCNPEKSFYSSNNGKTYYIGGLKSLKHMAIYEKGKQMQLPENDPDFYNWTRHELRLKATKLRPLSLDILTNPDSYFVGAYPANQKLIKHSKPIELGYVIAKQVSVSLLQGVMNQRKQYGVKTKAVLNAGVDPLDFIDAIARDSKKPQNNIENQHIDKQVKVQLSHYLKELAIGVAA